MALSSIQRQALGDAINLIDGTTGGKGQTYRNMANHLRGLYSVNAIKYNTNESAAAAYVFGLPLANRIELGRLSADYMYDTAFRFKQVVALASTLVHELTHARQGFCQAIVWSPYACDRDARQAELDFTRSLYFSVKSNPTHFQSIDLRSTPLSSYLGYIEEYHDSDIPADAKPALGDRYYNQLRLAPIGH